MASTGASPSDSPAAEAVVDEDDDEQAAEMPLTMAASVVLSSLPKDASEALQGAGALPQAKVTVRFKPVGSAQALSQQVFKISSTQRFEAVVNFLRKKMKLQSGESVFCYVNSVFAPGLDENVGNLWRCFKTGEELVIAYAKMPAFG